MGALKSKKCARGHPMKDAYIRSNGKRECRLCSLERSKIWHKKNSAKHNG